MSAADTVLHLQRNFPHHLNQNLIAHQQVALASYIALSLNLVTGNTTHSHMSRLYRCAVRSCQLLSLITRLFSNQSPPPSSVLSLDLNKVDPSVLAAAKSEMNVTFEKKLLRPGDTGYEYDKQVDYDDPSEPSEWDD